MYRSAAHYLQTYPRAQHLPQWRTAQAVVASFFRHSSYIGKQWTVHSFRPSHMLYHKSVASTSTICSILRLRQASFTSIDCIAHTLWPHDYMFYVVQIIMRLSASHFHVQLICMLINHHRICLAQLRRVLKITCFTPSTFVWITRSKSRWNCCEPSAARNPTQSTHQSKTSESATQQYSFFILSLPCNRNATKCPSICPQTMSILLNSHRSPSMRMHWPCNFCMPLKLPSNNAYVDPLVSDCSPRYIDHALHELLQTWPC